jgi:hypothetical protein
MIIIEPAPYRFPERLFQRPNPATDNKLIRAGHKQVNVIGHNYVTSDCDIVFFVGSFRENAEGITYYSIRETFSTSIGAKCDEEQRIGSKNALKSGRNSRISFHLIQGVRCNRRPAGRRSFSL